MISVFLVKACKSSALKSEILKESCADDLQGNFPLLSWKKILPRCHFLEEFGGQRKENPSALQRMQESVRFLSLGGAAAFDV